MKNKQYHCTKCGSMMDFRVLNAGKLPDVVGCKTNGCHGRSVQLDAVTDTTKDPDGVFFRPGKRSRKQTRSLTGSWTILNSQSKKVIYYSFRFRTLAKQRTLIDCHISTKANPDQAFQHAVRVFY